MRRNSFSTSWIWFNVFGRVCEYGNRPEYAFFISLGLVLIGSYFFHRFHKAGLIIPSKAPVTRNAVTQELDVACPPNYPKFHPMIFSLEVFIPFFKLDQTANWMAAPNETKKVGIGKLVILVSGKRVCQIFWLFSISGAVLTALWLGALTGLAKA